MEDQNESGRLIQQAIGDFHEARRKAVLEGILANLSRKPADLLSYDEVRRKIRMIESAAQRLQVIPLDKIAGSVNRYTDFSRSFLPRNASDLARWTRVRQGVETLAGLPPIEVYQVGDVYFVKDGHHRVSVAREIGADTIEAYVTPVYTRVPLASTDQPDDLIIKSEYDDFLEKTRLDELRPGANLLVTVPGQYPQLLEHISVHRYFMGENRGADVPYADAVADWYDHVYEPVADLIRSRNLLRDFPGRTETDLYLWIMDHRVEISGSSALGWEVSPELAAADLAKRYSPTPHRRLPRLLNRALRLITPEPFEPGPPPGAWRYEHQSPHRGDHLFDDILAAVTGRAGGWPAVQAAVELARREDARLTGLHVVPADKDKTSPEVQAITAEFLRRCSEAGVAGRMVVETGQAADVLIKRSPWVDLVVFRLNFPPPSRPVQRLKSGVRSLIRRGSSPLLAIPGEGLRFESALLAYGPGRKSDEALFMATYLAARWHIPLTVITVTPEKGWLKPKHQTGGHTAELDDAAPPLERARRYLEAHGVEAQYQAYTGEEAQSPARCILLKAETDDAGLIIMGGYEAGPLREGMFGSTVDHILRSSRRPVLICR